MKKRKWRRGKSNPGVTRALAASTAIVPLVMTMPLDSVQAVAVNPLISSTALQQKIDQELDAHLEGSLEVGTSLVIDLEEIFEDAEDRIFSVINYNPMVAEMKLDRNKLWISGKRTGSTSVDFIAQLEGGQHGSVSTYRERFRLVVEPTSNLNDADGQGIAIDDIVRYLKDADRQLHREDVHHLLHNMPASAPVANRAPMASELNLEFVLGKKETITIDLNDFFFDPDGDELFYTAEAVNEEMYSYSVVDASISEGSSLLSVSLNKEDILPGKVYVTARDREDSEDWVEKVLNFHIYNVKPIVPEEIVKVINEDSTLTGQIEAEDPDEDKLFFYIENEPLHGDLVLGEDGYYEYTPYEDYTGEDSFTIEVNDTWDSVYVTVKVTVNNVNDPPVVLYGVYDQSVDQDQLFTYELGQEAFYDPDEDDVLTYTAELADGSDLPDWLSFNPETLTFSGTPGNSDVGELTIAVKATDLEGASATDTFVLTVENVNDPPVVLESPTNQNVNQDQQFTYALNSETFFDPDVDDVLMYWAGVVVYDGIVSGLPSWLSFDSETLTFSGTPGAGDVGVITVRVTAEDTEGLSVYTDFMITVGDVNDPPVVVNPLSDVTIDQGDAFELTIPANTFEDPDANDVLTYSVTLSNGNPLPAWLAFNDETLTFSGTPGNSDVGVITIAVKAIDLEGASATATFNLAVMNVNDPPTVVYPIDPVTIDQNEVFELVIPANTFEDIDVGDELTYTATLADGSDLPDWLSFSAQSRTFNGMPGNDDVGEITVRVTATDKWNASVYTDFTITVNNVNDPPVVVTTPTDQFVNQDQLFIYTLSSETFFDPDEGDVLTYTATLSDGNPLPSWLTFDAEAMTFSGTPKNEHVGFFTITVKATDLENASVTTTFNLAVIDVNDPPIVANPIENVSTQQGAAFGFVIPADTFDDPDVGDDLTYTASLADGSDLPDWLSFSAESRAFSGTPGNEDVGVITVRVTATDKSDACVYTDFTITVENVNDPPEPGIAIANQSTDSLQLFTFAIPQDAFTDPDGDTLTYTAVLVGQGGASDPLPEWLMFDGLTFSGTPSMADVGTYTIRVVATDGSGASASTTFQLTVEVGDVAVASHYDTMTFTLYKGQTLFLELSEVFYDAAGGSYAFTSDPIEPDLAYEASLNNDDGSFVISFTGQEEMTFTHTFKATDDQGEATTTINVNYVPVWSSEVSLYGSFSMQDKLFEHFAPYYLDEQMLLVPGISFYETPGWATQDVDDPDLWTVEPGYKAIIDSLDFRAAHGDLFWIYHVTPVQVGTPVSIIPSAVEKLWMIPTYPLEASYGSIYLKPYSETYEGMVFEHEGIFHDPDGWIDYYVIEDRESFPSGFSLFAYLIDTDSEESTTSPFQADALVIHMHYTLEPQPITIVAYHAGEDEESAEDDVEVGRYTIEFELNAPPSFYIDDWILMTPDENGNYMRTLDLSEWVEDEDLSTVLYQLYVYDAPGTITITPNTILEKPVDNPVITITGTSPGYAFIELLMFDSYGFQGYGYLDFIFADVAVHLGPEESTTIPLLELLPEGAEQVSFALDPYFEPEYSVKGLDDYGFIGESFFAVAKPGNYEELTTVFPIVYSYELGGQTIEGKLYIVMTAGEN